MCVISQRDRISAPALALLACSNSGLLARVSGSMKFRYNFKEVEAEQTPGELMMKELDMMYACPVT